MITSRTIQHNSDRTYDILFILLSHNEENDQKVRFRDLKCRNGAQNRNLHEKLSKTGPVEKFWLWSKSTVNDLFKVNGWRVLTWQCDVTLGLTWQYVRRSRHVERVTGRGESEASARGAWETLTARGVRAREAETSANAWRRVWCSFWPFLVGFCSGLAVLSLYAFALAVGWAERWYPRVAGTVGVTTVTHFWQWLLDEGEGSGRTPEMSIGTRKSEEWLWYHVNNIKWKKKKRLNSLYIDMYIIMYNREPYIS